MNRPLNKAVHQPISVNSGRVATTDGARKKYIYSELIVANTTVAPRMMMFLFIEILRNKHTLVCDHVRENSTRGMQTSRLREAIQNAVLTDDD